MLAGVEFLWVVCIDNSGRIIKLNFSVHEQIGGVQFPTIRAIQTLS